MLPPNDVIEFGQELETDVVTGATADILDSASAYTSEDSFQEVLTSVIADWARMAAIAGATYSEQAHASRFNFITVDPLAPFIPDSVLTDIIQGALSDDGLLNTTFLVGRLTRIVSNRFRGTVRNYVRTTSTAVGYARKTRPGCCAFCAMVALNLYSSDTAASRVVGRMNKRGEYTGRKRSGGKAEIGSKYHDFCKCLVVPVYSDNVMNIENDLVKLNGESASIAYGEAVKHGPKSTSEVLSYMREKLDTK